MLKKISVCITSYNQKNYLIEAIESVINQTIEPWEIIVVDDCSTDGSQEIIDEYARAYPKLIRPFFHRKNLGISLNKRFAQERANGDLFTYLDGDDRFLPKKLQIELETLMSNPDARAVYSNFYYIDEYGQRIKLWADGNITMPCGNIFREVFIFDDFPNSILLRNELVDYQSMKEVGFYDPDFALYEDWEWRIRFAKRFKIIYCPEPLAEYRRHSKCVSGSPTLERLKFIKKGYLKNFYLLQDLPKSDYVNIQKKMHYNFAKMHQQSGIEEFTKGNKINALNNWIKSLQFNPKEIDWHIPAKLIIPSLLYSKLKLLYNNLTRK
ncbi:MAG: glycosyltransferase [Coleofasciculus sp. C1-SOL-03]|uniref:glycosyltransferase n=1 Tax=Coleofasciculus sp. C1-SOL-03 TaxID=3069522 RepID=UPI0032F8D752